MKSPSVFIARFSFLFRVYERSYHRLRRLESRQRQGKTARGGGCRAGLSGEATNQQAEIAAATIGLNKLSEPCRVRVLSDSRYVVETMSGNFRKKANLEWWAKLDRVAQKHQIKWEWVKGHAGHDVQEVVDTLARTTAEKGAVDEKFFDEKVAEIGIREI